MSNRRRADAGLSFIEVLIAVVLLGLAVVGVMPSFTAQVRGSALQDRFSGARRWIVSAGDYAVSTGLPRVPCATPTQYEAAIRTGAAANRPAGWANSQLTLAAQDAAQAPIQYWNGTAFTNTCAETATNPLKLQQISLRVVSPDGTVVEYLQVVKSGA
jgi:type II secretory pathway pseudopilin PulG